MLGVLMRKAVTILTGPTLLMNLLPSSAIDLERRSKMDTGTHAEGDMH